MRKRLSATIIVLSVCVGTVLLKADEVGIQYYWPDDGVWFYYSVTPSASEIAFWVYCTGGTDPGCVGQEWSAIYDIPPYPLSGWVHDPVNHTNYHDRNQYYAQSQHPGGEEFFFGTIKAGWDCDDARSDLNQEYIDHGLYYGLGGFPGYIPGCGSWGGGLQAGPSIWNFGDYAWYVNRNNWNQILFEQIQNNTSYGLYVTSAYRNPVRQRACCSALASRHQWGDAVDVKNIGAPEGCGSMGGGYGTGSPWDNIATAAQNGGASFVESYADTCGSHVHGDYRYW